MRSIRERIWKLIGHIDVSHEDELHYKRFKGQIECKRGRGRLRKTIINNVDKVAGLRSCGQGTEETGQLRRMVEGVWKNVVKPTSG